jgi:hypothetical protein
MGGEANYLFSPGHTEMQEMALPIQACLIQFQQFPGQPQEAQAKAHQHQAGK